MGHIPMILVTGGTGFVGRALTPYLLERGRAIRLATRARNGPLESAVEVVEVGSVGPNTDWRAALDGVDCVVHLAALAHVLEVNAPGNHPAHFEVNTEGTLGLARAAAQAGVRRLIFLSSVKVYGSHTAGRVLTESDQAAPDDTYGKSKWHAEQGLAAIAASGALEIVVLRPPLIYGPHAKANFKRLLRFATRGLPLPLASIRNRRSLLGVGNLCAAIDLVIDHQAARNQTFLVDDGAPLSTPDLIRRVGSALGAQPMLVPCPPSLLKLAARLAGREADYERLAGDLVVSSSRIRDRLGYRPPHTLDGTLAEVARWYHSAQTG